MKPVVLFTVRFNLPVCPCVTLNVADERLELRVKLSVVAVTVKLTVVFAETDPEVPVTVTLVAPAPTLAATEIVTVVEPVPAPVGVVKVHVIPVTFAQVKEGVPVKFDLLFGAKLIVAVTLLPAVTVVGLIPLAVSEKPFRLAAQAVVSLSTSTEPRPVTKL